MLALGPGTNHVSKVNKYCCQTWPDRCQVRHSIHTFKIILTPWLSHFWWLIGWTLASPSWSVKLPCVGWEWTGRLQVADLLSSWAPGTTDCRILGTSRRWLALWLPSSARHWRLAEDPVGCSWSGNWCFDGSAEVVAGMQCSPRPRRCRWPDSCPADSASGGQSLPGEPSTLSGWGRWRSLARLLSFLEGSWTGPSGTSSKWRLLRHSPLNCGWRGAQLVKDWRSRSRLLGWRHFCAGLGFSMLLGESHRRVSHPVSLPDGTDTVLKDLWFGTHHMVTFKRSRPHRRTWGWKLKFFKRASWRSNYRFDAAAKPADTAETCASWIMANFSQRAFILGGEFFYHRCHHRVR